MGECCIFAGQSLHQCKTAFKSRLRGESLENQMSKISCYVFQNNEVDTEPEQKSFLNRQEEKMIEAFVEEYNEEKNMNVNLGRFHHFQN